MLPELMLLVGLSLGDLGSEQTIEEVFLKFAHLLLQENELAKTSIFSQNLSPQIRL